MKQPKQPPFDFTYQLHFSGGPKDGQTGFAFRPYFRMKHPDNSVYQAKMDGNQPVMDWIDDDTRAITLYFEGYWPEAPYPE